jgi:hypothetical protein
MVFAGTPVAVFLGMRGKSNTRFDLIVGSVVVCLLSVAGAPGVTPQREPNKLTSPVHERAITAFQKRVKAYVKLREDLEAKSQKLSKDATPEQIKGHQTAFTETVRSARAGAKRGDILTPDIAAYIRALIKKEFKGRERAELRRAILEADTQGIPLRVNHPYPEQKELTAIPPTLLLALPELPKQIRYRFVGRYLLLMDRENYLIIDYMSDALP